MINLDFRQNGIGSNRCGPRPHEKYRLCEKKLYIWTGDSVYIMLRSIFACPGMMKILTAVLNQKAIACVIVKDLSRFGRDYIEAGRLIQKTFPAFHVRFIAVTDNFNSQTADHNTKSLVLLVKNFINDSYCIFDYLNTMS